MKTILRKNNLVLCGLAVFVVGCCFVKQSFSSTTDGAIDTISKYAWGENIGWIDFGGLGDVRVTDAGMTGYAYGENIGWFSLNCSNTNSCATVDYKVANDGNGDLSGYAWSENLGWIDFSAVSINSDGEFTGYAYGENIGWLSLNCSNTDSCATVDYKVKTDYRPQDMRPACNNGRDDDGDGLVDYPNDRGCSELNDNNEVDPSAFIAPSKPNVSDVAVTETQDGGPDLGNIPDNVMQIAVSTTPDFEDVSWEDIKSKDKILASYSDAPKLYIKFRTKQGAASDVIIYERKADTNNATSTLQDGDLIKTPNNPDVYIIKYKNNKQYKRLLLSPTIFNYYLHLKWNNIKTISQQQLDQYQTSNLVKETTDTFIYTLTPNGDTGKRKPLNPSTSYDPDSIYEINKPERESYELED